MAVAARCLEGGASEWFERECKKAGTMLPFDTLSAFLDACGRYHITIKSKDKAYHALFNLKFHGDLLGYIATFRKLHLTLASELPE